MNLFLIIFYIFLLSIFFNFIDNFICKPIIINFDKSFVTRKVEFEKIRWYLLHVFVNIFVVITSFGSVYLSFKNKYSNLMPINFAETFSIDWFFGPTSPLPTLITSSGHLYHMLFFNISNSDIYHHLIFVLSLVIINFIGDYGFARNIVHFVLSGLPGILEYSIMFFYKLNYLNKKNMRYCITLVHCFLRFPLGFLVFLTFAYQIFLTSHVLNPFLSIIVSFIVLLNVSQYSYENIKSSIRHYKKIEKK